MIDLNEKKIFFEYLLIVEFWIFLTCMKWCDLLAVRQMN